MHSDSMASPNSSLIQVPALALQVGMYVAELDRPWLDTPFATQGFAIQDQDDIDYVAKHCAHVFVDPRQRVEVQYKPKKRSTATANKVSIKQEFSQAKIEFESAATIMDGVFKQLKTRRKVNVQALRQAINPLVDSVFRNSEALAALARMKEKGDYLFQHSLSTAIWCAVLGRHLGMEREDLIELALGASMMDVGMSELPEKLLQHPGKLTANQRQLIRMHINKGVEILKGSADVSQSNLNMLAAHHERHDGSGYPRGLKGDDIPLFARIAGLADAYDAMITQRPYSRARSSFEAVQELSDLKDLSFQASLVEQFVQTIGMFPTGSIVELNSGEIGVVVQQNPTRRLRPKLVIVLDANKAPHPELPILDLSKRFSEASDPDARWIAAELEVGAYGVVPDEYFL